MAKAKRKIDPRTKTDVDATIGVRVRTRRVERQMSQDVLGKALGISFQQVQKYEKGANRITMSRLQKIAELLDVPITYFYGDGNPVRKTEVDTLLSGHDAATMRLLRAYADIKNRDTAHAVVTLTELIAGE
jgi:transcriptional regulator with XRE-family HTH domain